MTTHTREEIKGKLRDLFTVDELGMIADMVKNGHSEQIAAAIDVADQEHEFWLNQYMNLYRPEVAVVDSKVELEIMELANKGEEIDTPAKEKFWNERMQLEREGKPLPPLEEALKSVESEPEPVVVAPAPEIEFTRKQLQEKLSVLGVDFKATDNKAELMAKLTSAVAAKVPEAPQPTV